MLKAEAPHIGLRWLPVRVDNGDGVVAKGGWLSQCGRTVAGAVDVTANDAADNRGRELVQSPACAAVVVIGDLCRQAGHPLKDSGGQAEGVYAVVSDTEVAANRGLTITARIPREADRWSEVLVGVSVKLARNPSQRVASVPPAERAVRAKHVRRIRHARRQFDLPTQAQVDY